MKYFAYGSNMSIRRLKQRTPGVEWLGTFRLDQHDLRFHKKSVDGSGKCDAYFTGSSEDFILGVLYEINEEEKHVLDKIEGLGQGYEEKHVDVTDEMGHSVNAVMYIATDIDATQKPYSWYKIHVLTGALESFFEQLYMERINAVDTLSDPNKVREKDELSIYKKEPK